MFDMGRTPITDAMKRLIHEGWLESVAGVSTHVAKLDLRDRYEYMQLRGAIEVLAAQLCAEHVTPEMILDFQHCLSVAQLAINSQNWVKAIEADIAFHRLCANQCGNRFLIEFYQQLLSQDERVFSATSQTRMHASNRMTSMRISLLPLQRGCRRGKRRRTTAYGYDLASPASGSGPHCSGIHAGKSFAVKILLIRIGSIEKGKVQYFSLFILRAEKRFYFILQLYALSHWICFLRFAPAI